MPSDTSLQGLGCGKHPTSASTCDKGGEMMLVVRSIRRADEPQFLVPAALGGRTLSISHSLMRVSFGSWTHGSLSLLSFPVSSSAWQTCLGTFAEWDLENNRLVTEGISLILSYGPIHWPRSVRRLICWWLETCTHALKNDKEGIWKICFSLITVLSSKVLCTHLPKAGVAFPHVFVPLSAFNTMISSASCICEPISEKNPCQTSLYVLVSIVL